jgi:hypothetical protein
MKEGRIEDISVHEDQLQDVHVLMQLLGLWGFYEPHVAMQRHVATNQPPN